MFFSFFMRNKIKRGVKMIIGHTEKMRRWGDAGLINESLKENKISASIMELLIKWRCKYFLSTLNPLVKGLGSLKSVIYLHFILETAIACQHRTQVLKSDSVTEPRETYPTGRPRGSVTLDGLMTCGCVPQSIAVSRLNHQKMALWPHNVPFFEISLKRGIATKQCVATCKPF